MKYVCIISVVTALLISACSAADHHIIKWGAKTKIELDSPPRDLKFSSNDRWLFVLNDKGEVLIYSKEGELKEKIEVGMKVDQIRVGPAGDIMYLSNRENDTVEVVEVDLIQEIDTTGSPFKGRADAPVAIAVFSDFQ